MTLTGSLNKDVAPVTDGCGSRLFNWSRFYPPSLLLLLLQVAQVKWWDRLLLPLSEGCVLFHINDKERSGSKKSLSYTHLFKKSQLHNTGSGSPQESSESWGMHHWQKRNCFFFLFVPGAKATQFESAVCSLTNAEASFMYFNGTVPARHCPLSCC